MHVSKDHFKDFILFLFIFEPKEIFLLAKFVCWNAIYKGNYLAIRNRHKIRFGFYCWRRPLSPSKIIHAVLIAIIVGDAHFIETKNSLFLNDCVAWKIEIWYDIWRKNGVFECIWCFFFSKFVVVLNWKIDHGQRPKWKSSCFVFLPTTIIISTWNRRQ